MKIKKWVYSNEDRQWSEGKPETGAGRQAFVRPNGQRHQKMNGFGGCFNEQGYGALDCLEQAEQEKLLEELFAPGENGCNLTLCRMPIGANDYSFDWYSLNETPGDYEMKHFSLERDRKALIPYIRRAQAYQPGLKLFASPWSPPVWMKNPPVYNWGKLIKTEENLGAYALYFRRFIEEYEKENIHIDQVHVQ
ncbi:MAG TPA: glycosyl hydrolase, partial [Clostridiales bacterium]|nr:glycosyl hydrolase [Clostridiales bacterium]